MTAPAPATEAPPAASVLAVVSPTTVITQYELLKGDISAARANAATVTFDLSNKKGIAAAKSYVFTLRRFNSRIDDAHKEAKAETLERGRKIDQVKTILREQVAALIKPHQDALDAIAKAETQRVAKHKLWISIVQDLARVPFGSGSELIKEMMLELDLHEQSADLLEEFTLEGKAALVDTTRVLKEAHTKALAEEAAAAELARLREGARIQGERDAEAKRIKDEEDAAAEVARKAQEAADAAALLVIEEAEQRAAQKLAETEAALAAANRRALDAEAVADALQGEALLAIKPAEVPAMEVSDQAVAAVRTMMLARSLRTDDVATPSMVDAELALQQELHTALAGKTRAEVVAALIAGTLHPAVRVDWSLLHGWKGKGQLGFSDVPDVLP